MSWQRRLKLALATLMTLGVCLASAHLWRHVGYEPLEVVGASMQPSFGPGDILIVQRGYYGSASARVGSPAIGELVVFVSPLDGKPLLKRVVAVGGQTIESKDGRLWIDGLPLPRRELGRCAEGSCTRYRERDYEIAMVTVSSFGPFEVPAGHFFVLGDRRDRSNDSRNPDIGAIDRHQLIGRIVYPWTAR